MSNSLVNKIKVAGIFIAMAVCLTGCDGIDSAYDNYRTVLTDVQARNQGVIEEFFDAGLITSDEKAAIQKSIKDKLESIANLKNETDLNIFKTCVATAMKSYETETRENIEYVKGTNLKVENATKVDESIKNAKKYNLAGSNTGDTNPNVKGLELIDDASLTFITNALNKEVYKIKSLTPEQFKELLVVLKALEKTPITDAETSEKLRQMLDPYFEKSGEKIFDITNSELIKESVADAKLGQQNYQNRLGKDVAIVSDGIVTLTLRVKELTSESVKQVLGSNFNTDKKYLVVDKKNGETVGRAYLMEYPVDEIIDIRLGKPGDKSASLESTSWWCDTNWDPNKDGKASDEENNQKLRINLLNHQIINADNSVLNKNTAEEDNIYRLNTKTPSFGVYNPIKTVKKAHFRRKDTGEDVPVDQLVITPINSGSFSDAISNSIIRNLLNGGVVPSMIDVNNIKDKEGNAVEIYYVESVEKDTSITRIYLKDYLELTYLPGVVNNEPFIATGRRVQINKIYGDEADISEFGTFIDKKGNPIENIEKLSLYDVIDYQSGSSGYYANIAEKLGLGNSNSSEVKEDLAKSKNDRVTHLRDLVGKSGNTSGDDGMVNTESDQILYADVYFNWIRPTIQFGNNSREDDKQLLNMADAEKVNKGTAIRLVGLCVNTSMFKTNLYTSWININGMGGEIGSLEWWNDWLKDNGFSYRIDKDLLMSMLQDNYKSQMANEGYIVFDVDTVSFIQKKMDTDRLNKIQTDLFTLSKLIGFLFISYSILLLGAWVFDVNITNGPDLLGKLSFNRWEAISSVNEAPYVNSDGKKYMDLRSIIIKAFIVMAIGVVLLYIDIVVLRDLLVKFVDEFTSIFQDVLHNK